LLAPLLNTLFGQNDGQEGPVAKPESWADILGYFNYYAHQAYTIYGPLEALQLVCLIIVISVLLANVFKYFSQRVMENLRIHTLLNLRKNVFDNVMNMHVGFFSNQRK